MGVLYVIELILAYVLYLTGICRLRKKRLLQKGGGVALVYHRIARGRGGPGDMTSESAFGWQMAYVARHFTPAPWTALLRDDGPDGGFKVLVTFDDGYRDNFTRALPVIERHRIHAVFFLATDFVFGRKRFEEDAGETDDDIFPAGEELDAAARSPHVTFGNHTASHAVVRHLRSDELEAELRESREAFAKHFGLTPEVFAYPRGRQGDFGAEAAPVLEKAGIRAAFTMVPGLVEARTPRYFVPRIGVSHVNDRVLFQVKMLGLLGWFVNLKNRLGR